MPSSFGTSLPTAVWAAARRRYRAAGGGRALRVTAEGALVGCGHGRCACNHPLLRRARREALLEAARWGEAAVFFVAPGVLGWVVPALREGRVVGGLAGEEILAEPDGDRAALRRFLVEAGVPPATAVAHARRLPLRPAAHARAASAALYAALYSPPLPGLDPAPFERNRAVAQQQREIAEAIHAHKHAPTPAVFLAEEQQLLGRLKAGDRVGARNILNQILALLFLHTPHLPLLQARALELMGHLLRAAVEDSAMQQPLLERHIDWSRRIIEAGDFERLATALRESLDDFMDQVQRLDASAGDARVRRALEYIAGHFAEALPMREIARAAGVSPFHLARRVRACTGLTLGQHVRRARIREACRRLRAGAGPVADLALALGFYDQSHFTRQFRAVIGVTPARYRRAAAPGATSAGAHGQTSRP